jgi:hypothetical protein
MKAASAKKNAPDKGYAILFVLFLVALVIIGSSTIVLDSLTEGRREQEAQMIWRGKQYDRAIRMYYRQFGRFPGSVDDLVKVQDGVFRFLREAYKNPTNTKDGSWRFIYVTPAGQLIGSVQYVSLQQMAFLDQQRRMGLAANAPGSGAADGTDASDSSDSSGGNSGAGPGGSPNPNFPNGNPGNFAPNGASSPVPQQLQSQFQSQFQGPNPQQAASSFFSQGFGAQSGGTSSGGIGLQESSDSSQSTDADGPVIGGFIIGVGGKDDKASIKVYKGGTTYKHWEFIFNPLEQVAVMGSGSIGSTGPTGTSSPMAPMPNAVTPGGGPPQIPQQPQ